MPSCSSRHSVNRRNGLPSSLESVRVGGSGLIVLQRMHRPLGKVNCDRSYKACDSHVIIASFPEL